MPSPVVPQNDRGLIKKVFKKYNGIEFDVAHSTFQNYSHQFKWTRRAAAYDDYIMQCELKDNEAIIRKFNKKRAKESLKMMDDYFDNMKKDAELGILQPKENRERYKMFYEIFRSVNKLDKDTKVEHSGTVNIVFGDELKDV